jgi:hypothetical protein
LEGKVRVKTFPREKEVSLADETLLRMYLSYAQIDGKRHKKFLSIGKSLVQYLKVYNPQSHKKAPV